MLLTLPKPNCFVEFVSASSQAFRAIRLLLAPLALDQSDLFFSHAPLLRLLEWYMGTEVTVLRMEQHETPLDHANLTSIRTQKEQPFTPCTLQTGRSLEVETLWL
jgi:hypothetical protein